MLSLNVLRHNLLTCINKKKYLNLIFDIWTEVIYRQVNQVDEKIKEHVSHYRRIHNKLRFTVTVRVYCTLLKRSSQVAILEDGHQWPYQSNTWSKHHYSNFVEDVRELNMYLKVNIAQVLGGLTIKDLWYCTYIYLCNHFASSYYWFLPR